MYYGVIRHNLSLSSSTLTEQFQKGARVAGQQVDLSYWTISGSNFSVYVYNYGFSTFTFNRIVLIDNNGGRPPISCCTVFNATSLSALPSGQIPVKTVTRIDFTVTGPFSRPVVVTLVGTDNRLFQWRIG